ncbi:hypothetical protein AB9M62_52290 [Bacillales bacterium AN1005]
MTYQEKKSIVSIVSAVIIFVSFSFWMYPQYPIGGVLEDQFLHFWGRFVLLLTLVSIIAHIIISIIFNIIFSVTTKEKQPSFEDELDKLIALKANRNSFFISYPRFSFINDSISNFTTIASNVYHPNYFRFPC